MKALSSSFMQVFLITSWKNHSLLLSVSQAGLVNNLVCGVTWGLFTIYFASIGFSVNDIAFLKALHPGIWGAMQLVTGTLSDKVGTKNTDLPWYDCSGCGSLDSVIISKFVYRHYYWHVISWCWNCTCLSYLTCSNQ